MNVNVMHDKLGHLHLLTVKNLAKQMVVELTGEFKKCLDCALAKARKKKVKKLSVNGTQKIGEKLYI